MTYFSHAGWTADWIQVAEALIQEEFERYTAIEVNDAKERHDEESVPAVSNISLSHSYQNRN
jgi:hypothetical protein